MSPLPIAPRGARPVRLGLTALLLLFLSAAQESPARIDGVVRSGEDRAPVVGGLVTLEPIGFQALTDSSGTFTFDSIPPGAYALTVHHPSGVRADSLSLRAGARVTYETRLIRREVVLREGTNPPVRDTSVRRRPSRAVADVAAGAGRLAYDAPALRRWKASRLGQALTLIPGVELVRRCAGEVRSACGFLPRLPARDTCAEATLYIDGERVAHTGVLSVAATFDRIGSLEVIPPGGPVPDFLGGGISECGAVWVRTGNGTKARDSVPGRSVERNGRVSLERVPAAPQPPIGTRSVSAD